MIKSFTLITALLMASVPAVAEESVCVKITKLAEMIMTERQKGTSLVNMMDVAADSELLRAITIKAYGTPRYGSSEIKELAIEDFSNDVALVCYNEIGG